MSKYLLLTWIDGKNGILSGPISANCALRKWFAMSRQKRRKIGLFIIDDSGKESVIVDGESGYYTCGSVHPGSMPFRKIAYSNSEKFIEKIVDFFSEPTKDKLEAILMEYPELKNEECLAILEFE